jgi:phospholipid transport system transporter-binding protein
MANMLPLPAKLDHSQATSRKVSGSVNAGSWIAQARAADWEIDASKLETFDSSALALLLDLRRGAVAANAKLIIHNAPARLTQLATLYGVNELIT